MRSEEKQLKVVKQLMEKKSFKNSTRSFVLLYKKELLHGFCIVDVFFFFFNFGLVLPLWCLFTLTNYSKYRDVRGVPLLDRF